jgi:hypothetical protein
MARSIRDPYPDGRASRLHVRARLAWAIAAAIAAFGLASLWGSNWSPTTLYVGTWTVAGTVAAVGGLLQWSAIRVWRGTGPVAVSSPPVPVKPTSPVSGPPVPTGPVPANQSEPGTAVKPVPSEPVPAIRSAVAPVRARLELLSRPAEPVPATDAAQEWDPILAERW